MIGTRKHFLVAAIISAAIAVKIPTFTVPAVILCIGSILYIVLQIGAVIMDKVEKRKIKKSKPPRKYGWWKKHYRRQ